MTRALLIELNDWAALYAENMSPMLVSQGHVIESVDLAETIMMAQPTEFIHVTIDYDNDPVFIYEFGNPMNEHRWRFPKELSPKQIEYFRNHPNSYRVEKA